jgi:hypothetical protein
MLLSVVTLAPCNAAAQTPQAAPSNQIPGQVGQQRDLEVLRRLEEDYLRAEIEDDTAIAGTILADDYVGLRPDGSTTSKADILSNLERHDRRRDPYQITATNLREHLFGDTACVTYTKVYTKPGQPTAYSENVLHMLIRRNGIWRLQLSSPLPTPGPRSK